MKYFLGHIANPTEISEWCPTFNVRAYQPLL